MIDAVRYHDAVAYVNAALYRSCNAGHDDSVSTAVAYKRSRAEGGVYLADAAEHSGDLVAAQNAVDSLHAVQHANPAAERRFIRLKFRRTCAKYTYPHSSTSHGSSTTA